MNEYPNPAADEAGASSQPWKPAESGHTGGRKTPRAGFASRALILLIGVIFVAGLTMWGAPKLAPYLPAPLAGYLAPESAGAEIDELRARLAALENLQGRVAALEAIDGTATASQAAAAKQQADGNRATLDDLTERLSAIGRSTGSALEGTVRQDGRIDALRTDLATLQGEIVVLKEKGIVAGDSLTGGSLAEVQDLKVAVARLQTRLNEIDNTLKVVSGATAPSGQTSTVSAEVLDAARAQLRGETVAVREAGDQVLSAVLAALKELEIRGTATELRVLLAQGLPYAEPLGRLAELSTVPVPHGLSAPATSGLPTMPYLRKIFPVAARVALAADRPPVEGEDPLSKVSAWLGAQVSVRPTEPVAGTSVGAVLSRIEAAIEAHDGQQALVEAKSLSNAASSAMASWLSLLTVKVNAEIHLASYIAAVISQS